MPQIGSRPQGPLLGGICGANSNYSRAMLGLQHGATFMQQPWSGMCSGMGLHSGSRMGLGAGANGPILWGTGILDSAAVYTPQLVLACQSTGGPDEIVL